MVERWSNFLGGSGHEDVILAEEDRWKRMKRVVLMRFNQRFGFNGGGGGRDNGACHCKSPRKFCFNLLKIWFYIYIFGLLLLKCLALSLKSIFRTDSQPLIITLAC